MNVLRMVRVAAIGAIALSATGALAGNYGYYHARGGHGLGYLPSGPGSAYGYRGGGYAYGQGQLARGYYTAGDAQLPVALGYSGAEVGGGYAYGGGGYAFGGGCGYAGGCGGGYTTTYSSCGHAGGCGGGGFFGGGGLFGGLFGGGCGGGCGGGYYAPAGYPAYPLPTTSSVVYNRPVVYQGWPANANYGYYRTGGCCH